MKPTATTVVSQRGQHAAQQLAQHIRTARIARKFSQAELAERARISQPTVARIERGQPGVALWAWLNVMEALGLLGLFDDLRDPTTEALMRHALDKPVGRRKTSSDLDF
jgi:transcriptional regulator with XRE-family HTH domain